jgi:hypothetical protein
VPSRRVPEMSNMKANEDVGAVSVRCGGGIMWRLQMGTGLCGGVWQCAVCVLCVFLGGTLFFCVSFPCVCACVYDSFTSCDTHCTPISVLHRQHQHHLGDAACIASAS